MRSIAFDVETYRCGSRNVFISGAFYDGKEYRFFTDINDFIESLFSPVTAGSKIWAHNFEFDFSVLYDALENEGFGIARRQAKSRLVAIKLTKNGMYWLLADSMNLFQGSLKKMGVLCGELKGEPPAWLGKRSWRSMEELDSLKKYNVQDVKVMMKFLELFRDKFGVRTVKNTVCSNALKYYLKKYDNQLTAVVNAGTMERRIPAPTNRWMKDGYYGGRTETFSIGRVKAENYKGIYYYDINSLYPYAQHSLESMPDPTTSKWSHSIDYDRIGMADALIKVYDTEFPLIPVKDGRLKFMHGKYSGRWTYYELEQLEQTGEGKVLSVGKTLSFEAAPNYFKTFIEDMFKLRLEAKAAGSNGADLYKLIMNGAGYGKWAEMHSNLLITNDMGDSKGFASSKLTPLFGGFGRIMRRESLEEPSPHTFVLMSGMVTARARIVMHEYFHKIKDGGGEMFYTDTDSVITSKELPTGPDLGQFKLEREVEDMIIVRPKFYFVKDKNSEAVKCRGLPRKITGDEFKEKISQNAFTFSSDKFVKYLESLRRHVNYGEVMPAEKTFSLLPDTKRAYFKRLSGSDFLNDYSGSVALEK